MIVDEGSRNTVPPVRDVITARSAKTDLSLLVSPFVGDRRCHEYPMGQRIIPAAFFFESSPVTRNERLLCVSLIGTLALQRGIVEAGV